MSEVLVYGLDGEVRESLSVQDSLTHVNGRVWRGRNRYYKGLGVPYSSHFSTVAREGEEVVGDTEVFYLGYELINPRFAGKTGIFAERYQPQFTDYIGSCGVKELSIIEHSVEFEMSSVEVLKSHRWDEVDGQYFFELNYRCGRVKYLDRPNPVALRTLVDHMVQTGWNFIWDKNAIEDVSSDGRVSDVADVFRSKDLSNSLGTAYAVLYSLGQAGTNELWRFLKSNGLTHRNDMDYVLNAVKLLEWNGVDVSPLLPFHDEWTNYRHALLNYLYVGRNCGHCCYVGLGERIKEGYIWKARRAFGMAS